LAGVVRKTLRLMRKLYGMERSFNRRSFAPDLWMAGFFSQRRELYPFDRFDKRWFLTDWEIEAKLGTVNDEAMIPFLENKLLFHLILARGPLAAASPHLVGLIMNGSFRSLSRHTTLGEALQDMNVLVCKPIDGSGGAGVSLVRHADERPRHGTYLLEERICQHSYADRIFPGSLNTIRVVTMQDPNGSGAFIAGAVHRFGCASSAPVDNFKQGGIAALVHLDTGCLAVGRSNPGMHAVHVHEQHPETGEPITGVALPHWREVKALTLELAGLFSGLHHVGWDICITAQGPRVIEGNSRLANPNLIQAHTPLLKDPRVREFLLKHGVLSSGRAARLEAYELAEPGE
jgi:hypothetical protein